MMGSRGKGQGSRKRILIVNVNWVGDVIFSTPFIRSVRDTYPDSHIACLLHPRCYDVLKDNPRINEIIIYDEELAHRGLLGKLRLVMKLRKKRFDTAFLLHRSFTKALLTFLAGIGERIGYPSKRRAWLLTKVVDEPDEDIHKVEYFLNIAYNAGIIPKSRSYEFFITDAHRRAVDGFLKHSGVMQGDAIVVLCPGGNWDPKRWPKENFARLGDKLTERFGAKIIISGAKKDVQLADDIRKLMEWTPIVSAGKTNLGELGALFERASAVVANDSGPMHLAVAMKANTIALFGPTSPHLTGPYGEGNYRVIVKQEECEVPCYDLSCTDNRCMHAIKVEDVVGEIEAMIGSRPKGHEAREK